MVPVNPLLKLVEDEAKMNYTGFRELEDVDNVSK